MAGGEKVPRKGGPGITQSDLLVINKIDLADAVGSSLEIMDRDAKKMRGEDGPTIFAAVKHNQGVQDILEHILNQYQQKAEQKQPLENHILNNHQKRNI